MDEILVAPNGTAVVVTPQSLISATVALNGNTFEVASTDAVVDATAGSSIEVAGFLNQINLGDGSALTLDDQRDSVNTNNSTITLGSDGTNESINGSNNTIQAQSGRTLTVSGTNDKIFANNDVLTISRSSGDTIVGSGNTILFTDTPASKTAAQAVSRIVTTGVDQLVQVLAALPAQSAGAMHEFTDRDGFATKASLAEPLMPTAGHLSRVARS